MQYDLTNLQKKNERRLPAVATSFFCTNLKEISEVTRWNFRFVTVWCRREEQRKQVVKNYSQTFVKNASYFLWIQVL